MLLLWSTQYLRTVDYERIAPRLLSKLADLLTDYSVQHLIPVVVISFLVVLTCPTNGGLRLFFIYLCPRLFPRWQRLAFTLLEFLGLFFGARRPYNNRLILPASFIVPPPLPYVPGALVFLHARQPRCKSVQAGCKTTAPDTSLRPVRLLRPKKWSFNFCPTTS